uniref:Aa_trans domain-containing protein n=2 Tax=Rhabditophanes sp. KR3021 TaxID=114890 RepID=A0AC35TN50_9BILA
MTKIFAEKSSISSPNKGDVNIDAAIKKEKYSSVGSWIDGKFVRYKGMNWIVTALFIVGDLAGSGLVILPTALIQCGLVTGVILTVALGVIFLYTAVCLGDSWLILLKHWKQYEGHCRQPYTEMAYRALGPKLRNISIIIVYITQIGSCVVYLLLVANNTSSLFKAFFSINISFCHLIWIVALLISPILFLKSPQDFWWAIVLAMFTTLLAVILICVGSIIDYEYCIGERTIPNLKLGNSFIALGTFLYAYGGHAEIPVVMADMKHPNQFNKSVSLAFLIGFLMYLPAEVFGYLSYGDSLRDSIIESIQTVWIQQTINLCIALHCLLSMAITFNPITQHLEEVFNISHSFGASRMILRSSVLGFVVFIALTVPTFGPLMGIIGGFTMSASCVLLPLIIYVALKARDLLIEEDKRNLDVFPTWSQIIKYCPTRTLVIGGVIFVVGIIGGLAATISSIQGLASTHFVAPCYLAPFLPGSNETESQKMAYTNCCGHYQNISIYGESNQYCSKPNLDYYL